MFNPHLLPFGNYFLLIFALTKVFQAFPGDGEEFIRQGDVSGNTSDYPYVGSQPRVLAVFMRQRSRTGQKATNQCRDCCLDAQGTVA